MLSTVAQFKRIRVLDAHFRMDPIRTRTRSLVNDSCYGTHLEFGTMSRTEIKIFKSFSSIATVGKISNFQDMKKKIALDRIQTLDPLVYGF